MGGGGILSPVTNALFGSPEQAPVPDYAGAAQATAQGNLEAARAATAANRVNQVTPYGNLTYTQTGKDSYGNPTWTATTDLSEVGQQLLDNDNAIALGLGGTTQAALQNVANTMGQPFNPKLPALKGGISTPSYKQVGAGPSFANATAAERMGTVGQADDLQRQISGTGMEGWDAATQLIMNRLQPQMDRQNAQLDAQLANQGIMPNSEAYKNAKMLQAQQQNDLMNQAQLQGQQVQNSLFNQNLQAGQFGNQAINQEYQNQLSGAGFNNQANQSNFANQLAQLQQNNANAQQGYGNQLAAQQANNQALALGAQNQLANAQLGNQANQQAYTQALTNYNLPLNTLSALRSGQQVQNPTFQNVPLQATTAGPDLLGAAGLTGQAAQNAANAQNAQNASMMNGLFTLGGAALMSPTGTITNMMSKFSDIRTKENIKAIGWLPNGLPVYEFEYKDEWKDKAGHGVHIGVMAQEVEKVLPHAVITLDDGYKMVNYALLG